MNGLASLFGLDHKIALVTGGAQGMGRMIAAGLISAGAKVYITSRKAEICEATARELSQAGQCVGIPADLNTPEAVVALAAQIKGREPSLDAQRIAQRHFATGNRWWARDAGRRQRGIVLRHGIRGHRGQIRRQE